MSDSVARSQRTGAYIPQPGTIPAKVIAYLQEQAQLGRHWVPAAELADHIGQPAVSPYLATPMEHGALIRRSPTGNRNLQEYAIGDGVPLPRPADPEDDDKPIRISSKVSTTPKTTTLAGLWPGLATPAPDTRPAAVIGAEKAWASGKQQNHRGSTPELGKRLNPSPETMTKPEAPKVTKKKRKLADGPVQYADIDAMVITDDPITGRTNTGGDKYSPLFAAMKLGQCIKCAPADAPKVGNALRKWRDTHHPGAIVRAVKHYPADSLGRVWLLAAKAKRGA